MLAIKAILADKDQIDTLIFDEIDTGISGRTAQKVSEKMAVIGQHRQVLCITHLPQIAAMADTHFEIEKHVEGTETITQIHPQTSGRCPDHAGCSWKCKRDEGIGTATKKYKTEINHTLHTKRGRPKGQSSFLTECGLRIAPC